MRLHRIAILLIAGLLLASACGSTDNKGSASKTTKAGAATSTTKGGGGSTSAKGTVAAAKAANALYAAWKAGDRTAAAKVAKKPAIDALFAKKFSVEQKFYGCGYEPSSYPCVYTYKGGATIYRVTGSAAAGYRVAKIEAPKKKKK